MTQQEYNDYIAHGGKWGFTNGIPNGKRKAVKKYMNKLGKNMNHFGESFGDAFKKRFSFETALDVQNKNVNRSLHQIASNKKSYRPNQKKEPVNTEIVELNGELYEVKVSNRSAKNAEKKHKQLEKTTKKLVTDISRSARRFGKSQEDIKNSKGAKKIIGTLSKYIQVEDELRLRKAAGQQHKAKTNEIINKAKAVDKLRYPKKKK